MFENPRNVMSKKSSAYALGLKLKPVYLLVRHVPFIAKGAGFLLQCTKCSRQASLVQMCLEPQFCTWRAAWQHDEPTDLFFRLNKLCIHLSGSNL